MDLATFFLEFQKTLSDDYQSGNITSNQYNKNREWTRHIKGYLKELLKKEGKYYPEYFDIDHTWWDVKTKKMDKVRYHNWTFKIAIEHENTSRDWTYEVEKLDSIICPLRIVIGYMPNNEREKEKAIVEKQRSKMNNLGKVSGEFGVILLNKTLDNFKEDPFNIKCYRLTEQEVEELNYEEEGKLPTVWTK